MSKKTTNKSVADTKKTDAAEELVLIKTEDFEANLDFDYKFEFETTSYAVTFAAIVYDKLLNKLIDSKEKLYLNLVVIPTPVMFYAIDEQQELRQNIIYDYLEGKLDYKPTVYIKFKKVENSSCVKHIVDYLDKLKNCENNLGTYVEKNIYSKKTDYILNVLSNTGYLEFRQDLRQHEIILGSYSINENYEGDCTISFILPEKMTDDNAVFKNYHAHYNFNNKSIPNIECTSLLLDSRFNGLKNIIKK